MIDVPLGLKNIIGDMSKVEDVERAYTEPSKSNNKLLKLKRISVYRVLFKDGTSSLYRDHGYSFKKVN